MITPRQQRVMDQGEAWVRGESTHNAVDDECTPDFSCCVPALFTRDRTTRRAVVNRWRADNDIAEIPLDA